MTLQQTTDAWLRALGFDLLEPRDEPSPQLGARVQIMPIGFVQAEWSIFTLQWPVIAWAALVGRE